MTVWRKGIIRHLRLDTFAGFGSSDTKILQYTNARSDVGPDQIFSHNHGSYGTAGLEIIINKSGLYSFVTTNFPTDNDNAGLSLNSSQLTTNITSINAADILNTVSVVADKIGGLAYIGYFVAGGIIRPHTNGITKNTNNYYFFSATYLGNAK